MSGDISADTRSTCCSLFSTRPTPRPNVTITVSGVSVDFGWYRYIAYATKSCEISQGLVVSTDTRSTGALSTHVPIGQLSLDYQMIHDQHFANS